MARNVILVQGAAREEGGKAIGATITPGMLVMLVATGFSRHNVAGGAVAPIAFARENHENDGSPISTAIAQNDTMTVIYPETGAVVNAVCNDTVARGEALTSAGNGQLRLRAAGEAIIGAAKADAADGRVLCIVGGAAPTDSI